MKKLLQNRWFLCLVSVLLFVPGWYRITGLTMMGALVPLLLISHGYDASRRSFWRMAGYASLTFALWNVAVAWWVWNASPMGVLASTLVEVLLFDIVFMIYHYASKRAKPSISYILLVSGWIAAEYLYLTWQASFPWILIGNGFASDTWAVQWYSVTGVFGGSLWVLLVNLLLFQFIVRRDKRRLWQACAVAGVPLVVSLVMFWTYRDPAGPQTTITVVQPNIEPYTEKFEWPQERQNDIMLALAAQAPREADIIAFPETAVEDNIWEHDLMGSRSVVRLHEFMKENYPASQLITGATTYRLYPDEKEKTRTARHSSGGLWYDVYNTALAIDSTERVALHHKNKLVIGVEMMPDWAILRPLYGLIVDLGGTTGQLGTDGLFRVFRHPRPSGGDVLSAAPVCYESVYGQHFAEFTARGAQVMVIITNDGWWGDTPGYRQHFSFARLRAIETRRYVARSANTGISGFISPRGDVRETLGWDVRGTLTDTVALNAKVTPYARYGDVIARVCVFLFALAIFYYIVYRLRKRNHLVE